MAEATGSRPVGPNQSTVGSTPTARTILAEGSTLFQMLRNPGPADCHRETGTMVRGSEQTESWVTVYHSKRPALPATIVRWGTSSVDRAPVLQAGGDGFESHVLHQWGCQLTAGYVVLNHAMRVQFSSALPTSTAFMGGEMPFKDDDTRREHFRKRYNSLRQKWLAANGPCRHCGSWDDLDVDHVERSTKEAESEIWNWSEARRSLELSKCQVLCRPCHRTKTADEQAKPLIHGTVGGYRNRWKCRCVLCRAAYAERKRQTRAALRGLSE